MTVSRRDFIKWSAAAGTWLYVSGATGSARFMERAFGSPIPGGTLNPVTVPKYVTPLLIPPVMPKAGRIKRRGGKNADYYEISMREFKQQILPATLPMTTVWGYGPTVAEDKRAFLAHNAPSFTIEADANRPVQVKWINDLKAADGTFLPHLLPVDQTLHWANPGGGVDGRDSRPTFEDTPDPYEGPVPIVTHLHGAVGVGDESDGYPESWYLPAADNIPAGYAEQGTWYEYFGGKAMAKYGAAWGRGYSVLEYPNDNRASTLWYHDHTLGMTRTNVYAGPAGFYIVRGGPGDMVLDSRTGLGAALPGPAPKEGDKFPPNKQYREIPVVIQDRAFNDDGSLFYPDSRAFFDEASADDPGFIPHTDLSPQWNPEFFGNMIMVNGNTWPFLDVEQARYRLRLLNGCQSRFLILDFSAIPGVEVWQIGNEGGFLASPVNITAADNRLLMGLAERADVIVDFTNVPVGNYNLLNVGPDEPFGGGEPDADFDAADGDTTGQVMQFRVAPALTVDPSTPSQFLQLPVPAPLPAPVRTRRLALIEIMSMYWDGPAEAMLGVIDADGNPVEKTWMEEVTENPAVGDTEVWELFNTTADAHPMHVHEVTFEVLNREKLVVNDDGDTITPVQLTGEVRAAEPGESGFKDTVIAYPGEVTRIAATFLKPGQFVWHCHIVEHEDNEMMRPYRIGPADPMAPGGSAM